MFIVCGAFVAVPGLCVLLIAGIMRPGACGQAAAHAVYDPELAPRVFGYEIIPMSKTTFRVSVFVLFAVESSCRAGAAS